VPVKMRNNLSQLIKNISISDPECLNIDVELGCFIADPNCKPPTRYMYLRSKTKM
jgi:hypothetical protein